MPTTWNFTHFTAVSEDGGAGTGTSFTATGASQAGATSITENDDVLTFGSGGLGGYHNSNDLADSYTIPFSNGSGAFLIYDGSYSVGGITGMVVLADATGQHYLITDGDPGFTGGEAITTSAVDFCFAPGTQISTPTGHELVENLKIGDPILTTEGETVSVKWMGHQSFLKLTDPSGRRTPVKIEAGALGPNQPVSDLCITADHALLIDGMLINAGALVNDSTIRFLDRSELPDHVVYYHVETENHDTILANGVPAETFVDYVGRRGFDNYQEYLDLYGCERIIPEMPYTRISAQRQLPSYLEKRFGITPYEEQLNNEMENLEEVLSTKIA